MSKEVDMLRNTANPQNTPPSPKHQGDVGVTGFVEDTVRLLPLLLGV